MPNLNRVFLMGNLTRDPELKYIPSGSAVVTLGLAVNRFYSGSDGEKKQDVSYFNIVVWNKLAEICSQYLHKGSPVFVEGRLQSRSWETSEGQKRNTVEVVAQRVDFLSRGKSEEDGPKEFSQDKLEPDQGLDDSMGLVDESGPSSSGDSVPF